MTSYANCRFLIAAIALVAVAGHPVRGRADDAPCRDLVAFIVWENVSGIEPMSIDTGENILKELKSRNYSITDPAVLEEFADDSYRSDSELYKFDFDSDGLDDFVFITRGGTALCQLPYFLKSNEKKQLVRVKGIDSSDLENEGKLCNNWGQSLSFLFLAGEIIAITKDFNATDLETDADRSPQAPIPVDFAAYKIGITEESEPTCRVRMELRVE